MQACFTSDNKLLRFLLWYFFAISLAGAIFLVSVTQTYLAVLCAADAEVLRMEEKSSHTLTACLGALLYWAALGLTVYILRRRYEIRSLSHEGYVPVEQELEELN
jgi:hypothetical protein